MQWRVTVEGGNAASSSFGHLVLGEHEFASRGRVEIDAHDESNSSFGPIPTTCGASDTRAPSYRLVTSTPDEVEAIGGDELLYLDGKRRGGGYAVDPHPADAAHSRSRSSGR